jgi:hypothetical protein
VEHSLRVLLAEQGRREEAIFFGKQSVNRLQSMRGEHVFMDRELQQSFLRIHLDYYRGLAGLLIEAGRLPEAQQVLNMLKEQEYFEFIRGEPRGGQGLAEKASLIPAEAECKTRYEAISLRVVGLQRERTRLEAIPTPSATERERLDQIRVDLKAAGWAFRELLKEVVKATSNSEAALAALHLKDLQSTLAGLAQGTVLLHYVTAPRRLYVILTLPRGTPLGRWVDVEDKTLNQLVFDFLSALRTPAQHPLLPVAQNLYRLILGPVEEDIRQAGATNLLVSLDGSLRYIPLTALHDGDQYMVQRFRMVLFTEAGKD